MDIIIKYFIALVVIAVPFVIRNVVYASSACFWRRNIQLYIEPLFLFILSRINWFIY